MQPNSPEKKSPPQNDPDFEIDIDDAAIREPNDDAFQEKREDEKPEDLEERKKTRR